MVVIVVVVVVAVVFVVFVFSVNGICYSRNFHCLGDDELSSISR